MIRLKDLTATDLAEAAVANLVAHAGWVQRHTPGMHVVDEHDLVLIDSELPCDTFNLVCRARLARGTARERIADAVDYFGRAGRPFSWWLSPSDQPPELGELLLDAGLQRAETELAMAADLATLRACEGSPDGLQIRRPRTPDEIKDFAEIVAANWTPPDPDVLRFYELAVPALLDEGAPL